MGAPVAAAAARDTPPAAGLTNQQARALLATYGPNEPAPAQRVTAFLQFIRFFANPLVVILLIAAVVSATLGELVNSTLIVLMVLLSVALNFAQSYRSQRAAERLRESVAPTATVRRDDVWREIARCEVVPGDVIRLVAGDLVPADARLLDALNLHVNQAALTGESMPAEKELVDTRTAATTSTDPNAPDRVFLGTSIVSGSATALVTATGPRTAFGDIAAHLRAKPPETEFERGTRQFGLLIMETVAFLVFFVFLFSIVNHQRLIEVLLFAIALAVGLTPEFLPMITTVTLSRGAIHMSRRKVIVKHLESIQNFGSMDILCSDKTGTITGGDMRLDQMVDPAGASSEWPLRLAYLNSAFETGIRSPLDTAILTVADSRAVAGLTMDGWAKLGEVPFDFERRCLSVVLVQSGERSGARRRLICKGAPESVLAASSRWEVDSHVTSLDAPARATCDATYRQLSEQGYRVLAVAYRDVSIQPAYRASDEHDLTFAGYLAFLDPPLADAVGSLRALRADGVQVKILTGDGDLVARHVCAQVGLDVKRIVVGAEMERMDDATLGHVAEQVDVFARVSPAQKNRIIRALKTRGHVVGFMGDGINDALSLHAADVGISVAGAVDVAKDAADIILLQPGLGILHAGIIEGRKAFGNVMKYLLMGTSSNFGNMFSMAGASIFLPFLPMLPTQILLNNFLYDLSQVTIPTDNVDATYIQQPHRWDISLIRNFMVFIGPVSSIYDFLTFFVLLSVFHANEALFHTGWFVESLATQTLVLFVIRTAGNPLKSQPSRALTVTTIAIVLIGMALPFSPLAGLLGFVPLPAAYFLILVVFTATYLGLVEMVKRRLMRQVIAGGDPK
jgi:P-type Mg2+ transporter